MPRPKNALTLLDENDDFIVLVKPQNAPVQSTRQGVPGLTSMLEDYFEFKCGIEDPYIGLVHRLDQPTGGLMLFAKHKAAAAQLSQMFRDHTIDKQYLTVVSGHVVTQSGELSHYLVSDARHNHVTAHSTEVTGSKHAQLRYSCLARTTYAGRDVSVLHIDLDTGRQHQIRVQLASAGFPVIGDHKYGVVIQNEALMLWSYKLRFSYKGKSYAYMSKPDTEPFKALTDAIK